MPTDVQCGPCAERRRWEITAIALASALLSAFTPLIATEREQVRAVINLIASVKCTTPLDAPAYAPIGTVAQFFHRGTGRGNQYKDEYQKLYDDGIDVALKYLGE